MTTIPGMPAQLERAAQGRDPRGWLVFDAPLPDDLQRAEDSRAFADYEHQPRTRGGFKRPATDTERVLLEHLGFEVPEELTTHVRHLTRGCRQRRWPALETQEVTTP